MAYNGCIVEGKVRNSILFPGVHVMPGAEVNDSIIFFDNIIHQNVQLNRVVSDVNTVFNRDVRIGRPECDGEPRTSVIGWNNSIPEGFEIGCGCRVNPRIPADRWPTSKRLADGEELLMRESGDALVLLLAGGIGSRLNLLVGASGKTSGPLWRHLSHY